ncbi:MAG TPA: plastocyanin/azurin family copper-binding protein [Baekduia sp.]|nr:plastocyanin/azurin family copper-binding protein [Baekduia sp.]
MIRTKLIAAATAVAATGALAVPALAATKSITVKDNSFGPKSATVRKGTTVKWVWRGKAPHNVHVTKGPAKFSSPTKVKGSFSKKLTRSGTYKIVCTIHPGMKLTLRVK